MRKLTPLIPITALVIVSTIGCNSHEGEYDVNKEIKRVGIVI